MAILATVYLISRMPPVDGVSPSRRTQENDSYQLRPSKSSEDLTSNFGSSDRLMGFHLKDRVSSHTRRPRTGQSTSSSHRASSFISEASSSRKRSDSTASSVRPKRTITSLFPGASTDDAATPSTPRKKGVSVIPEADERVDAFQRRNHFLTKKGMKHHPYPDDAPYMQAYDTLLLDNDRCTHDLLRRLNSNGSPTFHDYGLHPPKNVLDLGCGQGLWAAETAAAWRNHGTNVTGFDLVDVASEVWEAEDGPLDNLTWVQGNFLTQALPFADNAFDLVRMANLSLAIPQDSWSFVLTEVRRVLTPGGRLELIDDQIMFPYADIPTPARPASPSASSLSSLSTFRPVSPSVSLSTLRMPSAISSESTLHPAPRTRQRTSSIPSEYSVASFIDFEADAESDAETEPEVEPEPENEDDFYDTESLSTPVEDRRSSLGTPSLVDDASISSSSTSSPAEWHHHAENAKGLETIFESMLLNRYGIEMRPQDFIDVALAHVFGQEHTDEMKNMHLALAPPEYQSPQPQLFPHQRRTASPKIMDGADRNVLESMYFDDTLWDSPVHPNLDTISPKAAELLGLSAGVEPKPPPSLLRSYPSMKWKGKKLSSDKKSHRSSMEVFVTDFPEHISLKAAERLGIETKNRDSWDSGSSGSTGSWRDSVVVPSSSLKQFAHRNDSPPPGHKQTHFERLSSTTRSNSVSINAKAANRLGTSLSPSTTQQSTTQSPGLILWPTTFIPMEPLELEMHACKHMHALLGCKVALSEYVQGIKDTDGKPHMSQEEFDDLTWEYECFRRKRFNWPAEVFSSDLLPFPTAPLSHTHLTARPATSPGGESALLTPAYGRLKGDERRPQSASARLVSSGSPTPSHNREHLTFVRAFRVYEAFKCDTSGNVTA